MSEYSWEGIGKITPWNYVCGHCGANVASEKGSRKLYTNNDTHGWIAICPFCSCPTYWDKLTRIQIPGALPGNHVTDIPDEGVARLYEEARSAAGANSFSASVLCCRKLLMHIAVEKGADEGKKFIEYVEYLAEKHYIPPDARDWVDHIRKAGNEANHEVVISDSDGALELISFCEMLLRVIYEFPARARGRDTQQAKAE